MYFYVREPLKVTTAVGHPKHVLTQKQMTVVGSGRDDEGEQQLQKERKALDRKKNNKSTIRYNRL